MRWRSHADRGSRPGTSSSGATRNDRPPRLPRFQAWRRSAFAAFQPKIVQRHDRFLAQLDQAQAEVEIGLPVGLAHPVEHRAQAEPVGFFAEAPDECTGHVRRADRITHRDQRTAIALHHHEALFRIIVQHRLVGGQYQAGLGIGGPGQHRCQRRNGLVSGRAGCVLCSRRARPNITSAIATTSNARSARCVAGQRELPPQLVLVFDMAVGEEQQPGDRDQHQTQIAQPRPRPGFIQQRARR